MSRTKQRLLAWGVGTCFAIANVVGLVLTQHRRQTEAATHRRLMELKGRQGDALAMWHSEPAVPLRSQACIRSLRELALTDKLDAPRGASDLTWSELGNHATTNLVEALYGLLAAYKEGTAASLITYMRTRGESLSTAGVGRLTEYLIDQRGYKVSDFANKSLSHRFAQCWDAYGGAPGWEALIAADSGIRIWKSNEVDSELLSSATQFDRFDARLWQRMGHRYHNFANADGDSLERQLATVGEVTVADARLVIKHAGPGVHSICPYAVRFWYSNARQQWIPHLLLQFRTSGDIPHGLIF
jgi:hypothetical protein